MGLWNWIRTQATGVDIDAEQQLADSRDGQLRAMNTADYGAGGRVWNIVYQDSYDQAQAAGLDDAQADAYAQNRANGINDTVQAHLAQQEADSADLASQVNTAFVEGAAEGLKSMQDTFKAGLAKIGLGFLGFIPWWVWPLALIVLFFYLGGGIGLKRRFGKLLA